MSGLSRRIDRTAASLVPQPRLGPPARRWLARPFGRRARLRLLAYYTPSAISFSQIYPFFHHAAELKARHGAELRALPVDRLLAGDDGPEADIVLVQPWFTVDPDRLGRALDRLATRQPRAQVSFLDSFAPNDLRLARTVEPYVRFYLKRSLFRDRRLHLRPFRGDTNLTEYYADLYGLPRTEPVDWQVPPAILEKLRPFPNFFTAARFADAFPAQGPPGPEGRTIDLHARIGTRGAPWYSAMRRSARAGAESLGVTLTPVGRIAQADYMAEMRRARLCFSPFGYGEICWRDIEAFEAGSVLVKPDMGHLETRPDLYQPGVTYLAVRWDFADLGPVVARALADPEGCRAIAREAHGRIARHLADRRFPDEIAFLFD